MVYVCGRFELWVGVRTGWRCECTSWPWRVWPSPLQVGPGPCTPAWPRSPALLAPPDPRRSVAPTSGPHLTLAGLRARRLRNPFLNSRQPGPACKPGWQAQGLRSGQRRSKRLLGKYPQLFRLFSQTPRQYQSICSTQTISSIDLKASVPFGLLAPRLLRYISQYSGPWYERWSFGGMLINLFVQNINKMQCF